MEVAPRFVQRNMTFRTCILISLLASLMSACGASTPRVIPTLASIQVTPENELKFQNSGGGEPRSPGYWLVWNSCVENNQAETARANGGRAAGWILMDDLLIDPGILIGALQVETCEQGSNLLNSKNLQGLEMTNDAAYTLAAQLIAAQFNLVVGSEYCPASDQAVSQAQLLLLELNFDGTGGYLGPPKADEKVEAARKLTEQLASYNTGALCLP